MQLVLRLNQLPLDSNAFLRWFWLGPDMAQALHVGVGTLADLAQSLKELGQGEKTQTWVLLPGAKVSARRLHYSEKEKKHLHRILPYQLEDALIDDIDDLHFALSSPKNGDVTLAYLNREWLTDVFEQLSVLGIEVSHCFAAPALLPMQTQSENTLWSIGLYDQEFWIKPNGHDAFAVDLGNAQHALALALSTQAQDKIIEFELYAGTNDDLKRLSDLVGNVKPDSIVNEEVREPWQLDYQADAINLCQGDFAQRLPLDRWWKAWKTVAVLLAVSFIAYLVVAVLNLGQLKNQNVEVMRALEAEARKVIPQGRLVNVERQVAALVPANQQQGEVKVVRLLSVAIPAIGDFPTVEIKGIAFTQETGELNINLQADNFSVFDQVAGKIKEQGFQAEILSANAQGNVQTARLNIKQ